MAVENYIDLLVEKKYNGQADTETRVLLNILEKEGCQVFFCDDYTSMLYCVL